MNIQRPLAKKQYNWGDPGFEEGKPTQQGQNWREGA